MASIGARCGWPAAGSRRYLRAQPDPYDDWAGNPHHDWSVTLTDARLESAFPAVGDLRSIKVLDRDGNGQWGGRVRSGRRIGIKTHYLFHHFRANSW